MTVADEDLANTSMVERVARALMQVTAQMPGGVLPGVAVPVLSMDPDFDDLPDDHTEGTEDDEITKEAVRRLARAAITAMRDRCDAGYIEALESTIERLERARVA